jgi:hypothetical protein
MTAENADTMREQIRAIMGSENAVVGLIDACGFRERLADLEGSRLRQVYDEAGRIQIRRETGA